MDLKDKKIIITGAAKSFGALMAIEFAKRGAKLVFSYNKDEKNSRKTMESILRQGGECQMLQADFTKQKQVEKFANNAIAFLGGVDCLVNNAGLIAREDIFQIKHSKVCDVFQVNTIAPLMLSKICANDMIERKIKGNFINISSIAPKLNMQKSIVYASSKAAMDSWTKKAAINLAKHGIRVNAIAPGVIESGMNSDTAEQCPDLWAQYTKAIPLGRPGQPEDIANMALFLAFGESGWITGKIIDVDGGHAF